MRAFMVLILLSALLFLTASARPSVDSDPIEDKNLTLQSQKRNAAFKDISRLAFKALVAKDFRDKPLLTPEERQARRERRRRNRKRKRDRKKERLRSRQRLPGRKQAYVIASKDMFQTSERCHTELFKQKVRVDGCITKTVVNRFCHGACRSFYIPRLRVRHLKPAFQSCSACVPEEYAPALVTLQCPARRETIVRRTVMKVKSCACMAVEL